MTRLMPKVLQREEQLLRATETICNDHGAKPLLTTGEVITKDDYRAARFPDALEEIEAVTRGPGPRKGDAYALAQRWFIAFDGIQVVPGMVFALNDTVVRRHRGMFWVKAAND